MFYAEIDETGRCFHITPDELPLGERILLAESADVLGKIWNGESWEEAPVEEVEAEPTEMEQLQADIAYIKMKMKGM